MKIKELLTDESKWCKGASAKDKFGNPVWIRGKEVCCFCLTGAADLCYNGDIKETTEIFNKIHHYLSQKYSFFSLSLFAWNDLPETTFSDVKQLVEELDI